MRAVPRRPTARGLGSVLPSMMAAKTTLIISPGITRQTSMTSEGNNPWLSVSRPSTWVRGSTPGIPTPRSPG